VSASDDDGGLSAGDFASFVGGDSFTSMPGINLRLVDLLKAIVGGVLFAFFEVVIRVLRLPFRVAAAVFDALASFFADAIHALFGAQAGIIATAFSTAESEVIGAGIAGLVLAALVVGGVSLVSNGVIERVAD
jgi:hypothetical protein